MEVTNGCVLGTKRLWCIWGALAWDRAVPKVQAFPPPKDHTGTPEIQQEIWEAQKVSQTTPERIR